MRVRLGTIIWTLLVLGGASLVGQVVRVLSVDVTDSPPTDQTTSYHNTTTSLDATLGTEDNNLMWFMQISDLHLSVFHDPSRATEFRKFASITTATIRPAVVLASGDLTDAKKVDMLGSQQYIEEWATYSDVLRNSGVLNLTVWLDIRGNHDNFNVPSLNSPNNYYQKYSVQGQNHPRSYLHTHTRGSLSVSFIAVDACLLPGPRRPFNFIGMVAPAEMDLLQELKVEASRRSNNTIWFGHYPTSCILAPKPGVRQVVGGHDSLAYLCGHLHTLGGLVYNMYTRQHTGALELELADWKDERVFRVAAIDHGLFSFTDVQHNTWPVILVTNPKHALFTMQHREPLHLTSHSTHIRVLLWSLSAITKARVRLDNSPNWLPLTHIEGPLYVAKWTPNLYSTGLHTLEVYAEDRSGRVQTVTQPFSLDGSQPSFRFWPRALLMSNVSMFFQFLFGIMVCLCVVPLCFVRYIHRLVLEQRRVRPKMRMWLGDLWMRKMWVLASVDRLFWPLVISAAYMPIGPWFIGEVLEGHVGVVFAWGTFVNSSYLPGSLTYGYGFFQMLTFHWPLMLAIAHCADFRFHSLFVDREYSFPRYLCRHLCPLILVTVQMITAYFFWLAYGTMALVLGPLRTWSAFLGLFLWYQATTLPRSAFRETAVVWTEPNKWVGSDQVTATSEL
ncbi:hypothetical protein Pcinc_030893 [Petrolisthes cinctipes]|uniref:Transmembrane protein 62 n=1 Tax=Petrolisthes cinctipes TaxID=88211 RepID=A0AAE1EXF1_PETCI|nr:hypothetical protein Pcinc_030893 [Petrolisthes cinctipes]